MAKSNKPVTAAAGTAKLSVNKIFFFTIAALLALIPLLMRLAAVPHTEPQINLSIVMGPSLDIASYYKFLALAFGAAVLLVLILYKILEKDFTFAVDYTSVPVLVLLLLILLAGALASYKTVSLTGLFDRHEGAVTYISYLIIFFVAANVAYKGKARWLIYALYPFVIVNLIMALLNFYGYNVFDISLANKLLLPDSMIDLYNSGKLGGTAFANTLGQTDYQSGLGGILNVLFLTRALLGDRLKSRITNLLLALGAFIIMLTSMATNGFFALVILIPLLVFVIIRSPLRKQAIYTGVAAMLAFILVFAVLDQHNPRVWDKSMGFFLGASKTTEQQAPSTRSAQAPEETFAGYNLPAQGMSAGSGRTYIWARTIELIKARPILGYGFDTLLYYFPQDDPRQNSNLGNYDLYIDKPHNFYLDVAFGSGVLALLALLCLFARHFWKHTKLFRLPLDTERRKIILALFAAWCAYLLQGLFNDSNIGTSAVFWILFGAGVSLLREELGDIAE